MPATSPDPDYLSQTYSIDLDWAQSHADAENLDALVAAFAKRHDVEAEVINDHGPTGWPVVQLTGPYQALETALREYNGGRVRETDWQLSELVRMGN